MNKALFFDFDGVVLDSLEIKTQAFREMFSSYGNEVMDKIISYHLKHGGVSRYKKFEYIYENILSQPLSDDKVQDLGDEFKKLVFSKVLKAEYIPGLPEFVDKYNTEYNCLIVSGTPQPELRRITAKRDITDHFVGVYGSPPSKRRLVEELITRYDVDKANSILFGDSETDLEAALDNGLGFVLVRSKYNIGLESRCEKIIDDFRDFSI